MKLPCECRAESISNYKSINNLINRYQKLEIGINNPELGSAYVNAYVWANGTALR